MKICKKLKIPAAIFFIVSYLFLPAGQCTAQSEAPPLTGPETNEPPNDCTVPGPGQTCNVQIGNETINFKYDGSVGNQPRVSAQAVKLKSYGGKQFIPSTDLPIYIASAYKYAVALVTVLTTVMLIAAGVLWTISAGNPEKINQAKQMISRSLTGLLIALSSYTLLYLINPDLVEFRAMQIMKVEEAADDIPPDYGIDETIAAGGPSELTNLSSMTGIPNVVFSSGVDARVTSDTLTAFNKAMDQFRGYNSGDARVTSATRTAQYQYYLVSLLCGCPREKTLLPTLIEDEITKVNATGSDGAKNWTDVCPTLANKCDAAWKGLSLDIDSNGEATFKYNPLISHLGGNTLDMATTRDKAYVQCGGLLANSNERLSKDVSKNSKASGPDWCIPKEQQKLIRAMNDAGFCVGLKSGMNLRESWHFEYASGHTVSTFCVNETDANNPKDENLKKLYYFMHPTEN